MAGLSRRENGQWRLRFYAPSGTRIEYTLGKSSGRKAKEIFEHVEELEKARTVGRTPDVKTDRWVREHCPPKLRKKLAAAELVEHREELTVQELTDRFIEQRRAAEAANSIANYQRAQRFLIGFFGPDRLISTITADAANDWFTWLSSEKKKPDGRPYAQSTVAGNTKHSKRIFKFATEKGYLDSNPFEGLTAGEMRNPDRLFFVSREMAAKFLAECPDAEWRLIFGLARFGGIRCPSELFRLKWSDVNFDTQEFTVVSEKTKRYGKGHRTIPIFPELKPLFDEAFAVAEEGQEYIVHRHRKKGPLNRRHAALTAQFKRIRRRAGIPDYPKPWQNCRATRATEVAKEFGTAAENLWLGHGAAVAEKHYLMVSPETWERAKAGDRSAPHFTPQNTPHRQQGSAGGGFLRVKSAHSMPKWPAESAERLLNLVKTIVPRRKYTPEDSTNRLKRWEKWRKRLATPRIVPHSAIYAWLDQCPLSINTEQAEAVFEIISGAAAPSLAAGAAEAAPDARSAAASGLGREKCSCVH